MHKVYMTPFCTVPTVLPAEPLLGLDYSIGEMRMKSDGYSIGHCNNGCGMILYNVWCRSYARSCTTRARHGPRVYFCALTLLVDRRLMIPNLSFVWSISLGPTRVQ